MKTQDQTNKASATPQVYASQDVPGNFGFVGCDSDQYETREQAEQAARESVAKYAPHKAFDVYLNGRCFDTVFYSAKANVDADEVRRSLINHDGYDSRIEVVAL